MERIRGEQMDGATIAGAALEIATGERMHEKIIWPNTNRSVFSKNVTSEVLKLELLRAFPNPSHGDCYLTYKIIQGVQKAELNLFDAKGLLVEKSQLPISPTGILELRKSLPSGVYEAMLILDGVQVQSIKIVVSP